MYFIRNTRNPKKTCENVCKCSYFTIFDISVVYTNRNRDSFKNINNFLEILKDSDIAFVCIKGTYESMIFWVAVDFSSGTIKVDADNTTRLKNFFVPVEERKSLETILFEKGATSLSDRGIKKKERDGHYPDR